MSAPAGPGAGADPTPPRRSTDRVRLVVIGDVLLDRDLDGAADRLAPDVPVPVVHDPAERRRPGGAGLAAALAAADDVAVTLVAPLADDPAGRHLRTLLSAAGVDVAAMATDGGTGEKIRVAARGLPLVRVDRGGDATPPRHGHRDAKDDPLTRLRTADAVLVADYGRGVTVDARVRTALHDAVAAGTPVVWDPHPRGAEPVPGVRLVTPNRGEAGRLVDQPPSAGSAVGWARLTADALRQQWSAANVCITLGDVGAVLVGGDGTPLVVPAPAVGHVADPCGAGDRFASAAACALARGALPSEAVVEAVRAATAFVAAGGAAAHTTTAPTTHSHERGGPGEVPRRTTPLASASAVAARIRRMQDTGATVVATGGCFDLLHAGHVQLLEAARRLGDLLVVCLNSDASVSRLKGPGRPVNAATDRAAVLRGLASVDEVVVFDEPTPEALLDTLRPDIWVKGADYAVGDLPEAPLLATWGGHAMVLPYLAGRSTTTILEEARRDH